MLTLPNHNFLDWSKLKALADEKINETEKLKFVNGRKHYGKRRKCWPPAFSPFPIMFLKGLFVRVGISWDCVVNGKARCNVFPTEKYQAFL